MKDGSPRMTLKHLRTTVAVCPNWAHVWSNSFKVKHACGERATETACPTGRESSRAPCHIPGWRHRQTHFCTHNLATLPRPDTKLKPWLFAASWDKGYAKTIPKPHPVEGDMQPLYTRYVKGMLVFCRGRNGWGSINHHGRSLQFNEITIKSLSSLPRSVLGLAMTKKRAPLPLSHTNRAVEDLK